MMQTFTNQIPLAHDSTTLSSSELLIFIPTYNERDNVIPLYKEIKKHIPNCTILFCDDSSPDGTGSLLDELAARDTSVRIMHRPGKMGLGTAHKAAFCYARTHGYKYLLTMDADFTHNPHYIPAMLALKEDTDIVIGSRYAQGGVMKGWGVIRLPFTHFWRSMIRYGLNMPYDCTGAFRLYSVNALKPDIYEKFTSKGFSFNMEALYHLKRTGARIKEVPIIAHSREHGDSKLSGAIMKEVFFKYCALVRHRIFSRESL